MELEFKITLTVIAGILMFVFAALGTATVNNRIDNAAIIELVGKGASTEQAACAINRTREFCVYLNVRK